MLKPAQPNQDEGLLDYLISNRLLAQDVAEKIKLEAVSLNKPIEGLLLEQKVVDKEVLVKAKASILGVEYFNESQVAVSPEIVSLISEQVAAKYKLVPISLQRQAGKLKVAMVRPDDITAIDFLKKRTGYQIEVVMASEKTVKELRERLYTQSLTGDISGVLRREGEATEESKIKTVTKETIGEIIKEPKIVEIVKKVLEHAIRLRASDIHIEPQENITRIRYRIDGVMEEKLTLDKTYHAALISRIKILAGMKIDERRLPQDGRFNFSSDDGEVDLRISSLPTTHGEKIVMRLLKKSGKVPTQQDLGLRGRALKNLQQAIRIPHGIILITGPTGSGKTTTLYSLLTDLNTPKTNIITLEDPVEYAMPGVNQVQVNPQAGLTFASGLRSFLRQDPNIIMVGEIRDEETASLAVQASLTGHLVFSTVHTNSAAGALPRLLDMKVEPFLLASSMTAVVGQRVMRRVCGQCKQVYVPSPAVVEDIKKVLGNLYEATIKADPQKYALAQKNGAEFLLYKGKGCTKCGGTGYYGLVGIFEVLMMSDKISKLVMERADAGMVERQAVSEGMITMRQDGYLKALEGVTSLEEVVRVAQV